MTILGYQSFGKMTCHLDTFCNGTHPTQPIYLTKLTVIKHDVDRLLSNTPILRTNWRLYTNRTLQHKQTGLKDVQNIGEYSAKSCLRLLSRPTVVGHSIKLIHVYPIWLKWAIAEKKYMGWGGTNFLLVVGYSIPPPKKNTNDHNRKDRKKITL